MRREEKRNYWQERSKMENKPQNWLNVIFGSKIIFPHIKKRKEKELKGEKKIKILDRREDKKKSKIKNTILK